MLQTRVKRWTVAGTLLLVSLVLVISGRSYAQGGDIRYGDTVNGTIKAGAKDTWHFVGGTGDVIALTVQRTSGNLEPVLLLQDPAAQPVAGTQAISGQESAGLIQVRLPQPGSYRIQVSGNGQTTGDYRLNLTLTTSGAVTPTVPAVATSLSPDSIAGTLTYGATVRGQLDNDIYRQLWRFRGASGDIVDIKMTAESGNLDPVLAVISPLGDSVAANDSASGGLDAGVLAFQLPYTGDYTIVARRAGPAGGQAGNTSGRYILTLTLRGPGTAAQNTLVNFGTTIQGRLRDEVPHAIYRLEFGGTLAVNLDLGSLHRLARVRFLTTTGAVLANYQGISPLLVSARLPDKGPFLIEVSSSSYENQPFTDFGLTVYRLSAKTSRAQPLRYGEARRAVSVMSKTANAGGGDNTSGEKIFFVGRGGDIIAFKVTPAAAALKSTVTLSGPQDEVLYQGDLGPGVEQMLTLSNTGPYEIEVQSTADESPLAYEVDVDRIGANNVPFKRFDVATDRAVLMPGAAVTGALSPEMADGWWLDSTAGQMLNLTASPTSNNLALGIALRRPDGSLLDVQTSERVQGAVIGQALLDQTGRYRVIVFDSRGNVGGQYTLRYEEAWGGNLQAGQTTKGLLTASNGLAVWSMDVTAGTLINVKLTTLTAKAWTPSVLITQPDGVVIASALADKPQGAEINLLGVEAPVTGRYHLVVAGQVTGTLASYELLSSVQIPFASSSNSAVQVNTTNVPVMRYAPPPTSGPIQLPIPSLINPSIDVQKVLTSNALSITPNATVRGEIARGALVQSWRLTAAAGDTLVFQATSLVGNIGPDLTLLDARGKIVQEEFHAEGATTVLSYSSPEGGPYLMVVRMGLDGGRYLLALNTTSLTKGPLQISAGTAIVYGQTIQGEMLPTDDADTYYFFGTLNDIISVQLTRVAGNLAPGLQLVSQRGTRLITERNPNNAPAVNVSNFRIAETGVYALTVRHGDKGGDTAGRYSLYLGLSSGLRLPNRGGGIITRGATNSGLLTVGDAEDTWLFQGHGGERVTFVAAGLGNPLPAPLGVRLQDTTGRIFAARDATLTQSPVILSDVMLPTDGIYRVQVVGASQREGAYSLTWQPERERLTAGSLNYNQTVNGIFSANRKADSWVFSGTAGDVLSIVLRYQRGDPFKGGLQVRAENGVALITAADLGDGAGARAENLLLPFSGSYTIAVANPDASFTGAGVYSLSVHLQDSKARSMGGVLRYGEQGQGTITVDDPNDSWVFWARAGETLRLVAKARGPFLKPQIELRNPTGIVLASAFSKDVEKRAETTLEKYTIEADGVYVVTVSGGPAQTTGDYLLSLDYTPRPVAATETIQYGETKEGLIADDRPRQMRLFSGKQGDKVTARMARESGSNLAGVLEIHSQQGDTLAYADSNGQEAAIIPDFELPYTGQYMLVETRYLGTGGGTNGRYKVSLAGTPAQRPIKGVVRYGQLAIGRLDDEQHSERITFTGKAGDVVGVISHAVSGDLDTRLALENAAGETLATNDDANGLDATLSGMLLPADGTYTVVLSRAGTKTVGTGGNYELTVNLLYQVNATVVPQSLIAYGQRIVGAVDAQKREVRYTFSGNQGDEIAVRIIHQTDDPPPLLSILDPVNTLLVSGTSEAGQTTIERYRLPASGLYTIAVARSTSSHQLYNPYALTLTLWGSQTADRVANTAGGTLRMSDTVTGTFVAGQAAQYWLFRAKAGQLITVDLLRLNGDLLPAMILIGPGGQGLTSAAVSTRSQSATIERFALPSDGLYSLLVLPGGPNRVGQYRLNLQPNVVATATPNALVAGQPVSGTLDIAQLNQHWLFAGQQGQAISIRMLATGGSLSPHVMLIGPDGAILAEGRSERTPQGLASILTDVGLPVSGNYTLVAGQSQDVAPSAGTYRLLVEMQPFSAQLVVADSIAYGQPARKIAQQGSTDYWAFTGAANDAVTITVVSAADGIVGPGFALQDMSGRTLAQERLATPLEATLSGFVLPANGRYMIALPIMRTGDYTLLIQRRQSWLPQGVNARPLAMNQALDGVIATDNLVNLWAFNGKAGDVVQIAGARLSSDLRLDLTLYGPSGYIASAVAQPNEAKVTLGAVRLPEAGNYLLLATRWLGAAGRTSGRYSLTLTTPSGVSGSQGGFISAYGQTVTGGILKDDDIWTFDGRAGDVIKIQMTRLDGNLIPTLKLIVPDGSKDVANARGEQGDALIERVVLPVTGLYGIAAGHNGDTTGGYRLTVERVQTAIQASIERAAGIAYGEQRSGELTDKVPAQAWVFYGKAGERITLETVPNNGSKLDPYLYVLAPDGSILAADDNSGGNNLSARLASLLLPSDGFYGAVVSASPIREGGERFGAFTISLQRSQPGAAYQGQITTGGSVSGALTDDQPVQEWTFGITDKDVGKLVTVQAESPSVTFNATLAVVTADGRRLSVSGPAQNGTAAVDVTLPGPGRYAILVSANARGAQGRYTLRLSPLLSSKGGS